MKQDIILAGVGGQGILSIAFVIDNAALDQGLHFKQAEVHGMAQRGGAVQSHLRLSQDEIYSELIPKGAADLILGVEPMETIRYFEYLKPQGRIVSSSIPMNNIPDYPDLDTMISSIKATGRALVVDPEKVARESGSPRAQNMVMLGAAAKHLIIEEEKLKKYIKVLFEPKGEKLVEINLKAFALGRQLASG
jgi:indolepyruvate ferredoxin oxidoreductase beta subunit